MQSFSQEASKYHKEIPPYLSKIGKYLPEYSLLQGCSEFVFLVEIQNATIPQAMGHIFIRTPNFASVPRLSTE